jgi:hypothetical protein
MVIYVVFCFSSSAVCGLETDCNFYCCSYKRFNTPCEFVWTLSLGSDGKVEKKLDSNIV